MSTRIINWLHGLLYENNTPSLTRFLSCIGYAAFIIGSFYMLINNINWGSYDVFAAYTGGVGFGLQLGNKFINSKYNSIAGGYETIEQEKKTVDPNIGKK